MSRTASRLGHYADAERFVGDAPEEYVIGRLAELNRVGIARQDGLRGCDYGVS